MVYQPASWNGDQASLLTQWLSYIPQADFATLNSYLQTQTSPLFNQSGLPGQLAAQIDTAYPLAASSSDTTTTASSGTSAGNRTKDAIIGVCVSVGVLLWIALASWIYKRVRRNSDRAVHKRLSEHMSMFSGHPDGEYGAARDEHRLSRAPSVAASEIDDRPSSFYASPTDHDSSMRQIRAPRDSIGEDGFRGPPRPGQESPTTYGPSVFGTSWFANPPPPPRARLSQNPFEDIVTQSYLHTSGSNGQLAATANSPTGAPKRRSGAARRVEVQKGMISQPTLQGSSLEYREF